MPNFNIQLLSSGSEQFLLIEKIVEVTGKDPDIVAHLVKKRQIIARNLESREAKKLQGELELLGAQVMLLPEGDFELPEKPLQIKILSVEGKPIENAKVNLITRNADFDAQFELQSSNKKGVVAIKNFSKKITEFFEELPALWFEIIHADGTPLEVSNQAFNWETFIAFPKTVFVVQTSSKKIDSEDESESNYKVHGKVLSAVGVPLEEVVVKAFDKDLRSEQLLGSSITDVNGHYLIQYTSSHFARAEKKNADLVLRVENAAGMDMSLEPFSNGESIIFNASKVTEVDLKVEKDSLRSMSRYEQIIIAITPLLDGAVLSQLTWNDAKFLSHEVDFTQKEIFWVADDTRMSLKTDIPKGAFFAWALEDIGLDLENDIPEMDLAVLLKKDPKNLVNEILSRSIERNIIPDILHENGTRTQLILQIVALKENTSEESRQEKRKRINELGRIAGLNTKEVKELEKLELDAFIGEVTILDSLVKQKRLSKKKKDSLNLTLNLSALTGKRTDIVELLRKEELENGTVKQLKDFVIWNQKDWGFFLKSHDIDSDFEETREDYAARLNQTIERLYPTATWFQRNVQSDRSSDWEKLNNIKPLFEKTDSLFNPSGPEDIDIEGLSDPKQVKDDLHRLNQLVNVYEPMGLRENFNSPNLSVSKKIGFAKRQIKLLDTFHKNNPNFDLVATPMSVLNGELNFDFNDIPKDEHVRVLNTLKREQRLLKITSDPANSRVLAANGIYGAQDIAMIPRASFLASPIVKNLVDASDVYERSREIIANSLPALLNLKNIGGIFHNTMGGNIESDLDALRRLPGYQDLFGSSSYCSCSHCQSIFSPAAYFTDIMRWLEDYILTNTNIAANSTLDLKRRRPDLWHLPLTCENTNTLIPTLTIVNEVLESFAASETNNTGNNALDLSDRKAIESFVYGTILRDSKHLHTLPFSFLNAEIGAFIEQFGCNLFEIEAMTSVSGKWPLHVYGITQTEFELLITPRHKRSDLTELYGKEIVGTTGSANTNLPDQIIPDTDVYKLLEKLSVSRNEFGRLIALAFVDNGQMSIEQVTSLGAVQADREILTKATFKTLDRLHRFIRLWRRKEDWSIEELGLFISVYPDINEDILKDLVHFQYIIDQLDLRPEEAFSLIFRISDQIVSPSKRSLLDSLFNDPIFTEIEETLPGGKPFIHPSLPEFDPTNNAVPKSAGLSRFLGALQLSEEDFIVLLKELFNVGDQSLKFDTNIENLTLLYRHATLADGLELTISELFKVIKLCPSLSTSSINSTLEIIDLIDFVRSIREIGISIDQLGKILPSNSINISAEQLETSVLLRDRIIEEIDSEDVLSFSSRVFSTLKGVEEPYAQQLLAEFSGTELDAIAFNSDKYRLNASFKIKASGNINIPQVVLDKGITEELLRQHLSQYAVSNLLPTYIAKSFEVSEEWINILLQILEVELNVEAFINDVQNINNTLDHNAPLTIVINQLQPWINALKAFKLDPKTFHLQVGDAEENRISVKSVFSIPDSGLPSWETIRRFNIYNKLLEVQTLERNTFHELLTIPDVSNLFEYLNGEGEQALNKLVKVLSDDPENAKTTQTNVRAILEQKWDNQIYLLFDLMKTNVGTSTDTERRKRLETVSFLRSVHLLHRPLLLANDTLSYRNVALDMLFRLYNQLTLQRTLGVGVNTLNDLISFDFDQSQSASRALRASLKSKLGTSSWEEIESEIIERLSENKRDALQLYLLKKFPDLFSNNSDLFHFFLLDTDFGGCAKTSRVKAATLSLQLYIHRIQLNLEQTEEDQLLVTDVDKKAWQEWTWMKNYRIWEANRKVFLYPENYLEPDLRDNRTAQYKALADELMQNELNEDTVSMAYKKYLTQFEKLSQLRIAGTYNDKSENTLYVFGINSNKECFMRKFVNQTSWTPWENIGFPVDSQYVSAIKYNGKLYLFWLKAIAQEVKSFEGGSSVPDGMLYTQNIKYSFQNSDGQWEPTHTIEIKNNLSWVPRVDNISHSIKYDEIFLSIDKRKSNQGIVLSLGAVWTNSIVPRKDYLLDLTSDRLIELVYGLSTNNFTHYGLSMWYNYFSYAIQIGISNYRSDASVIEKYFGLSGSFQDYDLGALTTPLSRFGETMVEHDIPVNYGGYNILSVSGTSYLMMNDIQKVKTGAKGLGGILLNGFLSLLATISSFKIVRLTTTLLPEFQNKLYNEGLDSFLSLSTQQSAESEFPLPVVYDKVTLPDTSDKLDFRGAMGIYFRELFHHIPFKIAHQLNAENRFKEAQKWLHYIFNPLPDTNNADPKNFWNYLEFRTHSIATLREQLEDKDAISAYKRYPFNPFAIARLRLSAFQKAVFMKYIDNLLDWGDYLFSQDSMESINEANLLYIMASDLLGKRPVPVGECKVEPIEDNRTYAKIKQQRVSEFLYEIENIEWVSSGTNYGTYTDPDTGVTHETATSSSYRIYSQIPVFCIPENQKLLSYWDRVEDRLHKIRNCMNIGGLERQLALFQPPIDPALLVRARAAGLSIDEIVASVNSPLPLYRFTYLLEKAKSYASQVQSFGGSLLSLLERKDSAQLTLLLNQQQQEIQQETRKIKEYKFQEIEQQYLSWGLDKSKNQSRKAHIIKLASENNEDGGGVGSQFGISSEEKKQIELLQVSTALKILSGYFGMASSIAYAVPQVGAPTSMNYGGREVGAVLSAISFYSNAGALVADMEGSRSSLVGSYKRRHNEWLHQLELVEKEEEQLNIQKELLDLRKEVTEKDLAIFDKSREQTKVLFEFHKNKLANEELYNWMLNETRKMYREAYRTAREMAKLAEQAYHFERDEDQTIYIQQGHWDGNHNGLLAGERLSMQLQRMERAYLEKEQRNLEIDQAFSLLQIAPEQLLKLRNTGVCNFVIPEFLFDLTYPGHYRRKIKSVRLSIPCITGPYTNVGVTLTLLGSKIRMEPDLSGNTLAVPRAKNESIATSKAQNDGGQFNLDFGGARYLPFEGAGAVESEWQLNLPDQFRTFDYNTIADVIIHISYTAKDGIPRDKVNNKLRGLFQDVSKLGLQRYISLNQEFASEFHRLLHRPVQEPISLKLSRKNFPFFLSKAKSIEIESEIICFIETANLQEVNEFELIANDDIKSSNFVTFSTEGVDLFKASFDFGSNANFKLDNSNETVEISLAINKIGEFANDQGMIDTDLFKDIVILLKYKATF